ncbi:hypothetical protein Tco_1506905 [Tanacetum coccineum]
MRSNPQSGQAKGPLNSSGYCCKASINGAPVKALYGRSVVSPVCWDEWEKLKSSVPENEPLGNSGREVNMVERKPDPIRQVRWNSKRGL